MKVEAILGEKMRWGTCVIISWLPRNGLKPTFSKRTVDDFAATSIIDLLVDHPQLDCLTSDLEFWVTWFGSHFGATTKNLLLSYNWLVPRRCVLLRGGIYHECDVWGLVSSSFGVISYFQCHQNSLYFSIDWITAAQWLNVLCHGDEFRFPPCTFTCGVMWCHSNLELHHHWCPSIFPKMPWSISTKSTSDVLFQHVPSTYIYIYVTYIHLFFGGGWRW